MTALGFVAKDLELVSHSRRGTRRAKLMATMDHSDIRGLVTALHRYVAGLPRSRIGDHRVDAHVDLSRIPLIVFARRVSGREWLRWCVGDLRLCG